MKLNKLARNLALAGLCSQFAVAAFAQQTDNKNSAPPEKVERVEVTGSSIKRVKDEDALPLQVIKAAQIQQMGIHNADDLMRMLGANVANTNNAVASNTVFTAEADRLGGGGSYANLRGLGPTGTLVLLNGRRLSNQGLSGGSVDLNAIPFEMIDRVEILKDGASAIYGTDAIGGVINFILKKDFTGASIAVDASSPTAKGGGAQGRVSLSGGYGNLDKQGFNLMGSVSFNKTNMLQGIDRPWATGYQPDKFLVPDNSSSPGFANIVTGAGTALGTGSTVGTGATNYTVLNAMALQGNCGAVPFGVGQVANITTFPGYTAASSTYRCGTDYGRQYMLQAPSKNTSGVLKGTFALGNDATGFVEFVGSHVETGAVYTPAQFTTGAATTATTNAAGPVPAIPATYYPVTGPYYQSTIDTLKGLGVNNLVQGAPISYRLRMNDWGNRESLNRSDNRRFAAGVDGSFGDYDYKASISHGEATGSTTLINGFADVNKLIQLLASGVYNPFLLPGQKQSQAALDAVQATEVRGTIQGGKTKVDEAQASLSGKLMNLPAGEMDFAVGVDLRREAYDFSGTQNGINCVSTISAANAAVNSPVLLCSGNSSAPSSSRNVGAFYGELHVPLLKTLEMQLAVRHDQYEQIGGTTNPKIAFKFTPTKDLLFRGSASTGFRAPTAQQLNLGSIQSSTGTFADPVKCPAGSDQNNPACQLNSIIEYVGGNKNLKPETSRQASLGVVFSPMDSLTASADYWQIKMKDRIHSLTLTDMLNNYNSFAGNFTRDADGNITSIQAGWINAGASDTKGIDFTVQHSAKVYEGKLTTTLTATKMISDKEATLPGQTMTQYVGSFGTSNYTLYQRWKGNISSTYQTQNWATTLTANYSSGYKDETRTTFAGIVGPLNRDVASYTTFNLTTSYTGIKNMTLSAGVLNLFDRDPAFTWHDVDHLLGAGWDARVADPRGRTLTVGAKYNF